MSYFDDIFEPAIALEDPATRRKRARRRIVIGRFCAYALFTALAGSVVVELTSAERLGLGIVAGSSAVAAAVLAHLIGLVHFPRAIRSAVGRSRLVDRLYLWLPELSHRVREAGSADEVWNALEDLCELCGVSEVSWRTAGLKPPDVRQTGSRTGAGRSWTEAKYAGPVDRAAYLEIRFVFPDSMGKLNDDLYHLLEIVAAETWAAFRRLYGRSSG